MKGTVRATLNRMTALGQTLVSGHYTKEDLRQIITIISELSKEEAEQVLKRKDATVMELILCKGLVNAFEKGEELNFIKSMMKRFNCGITVVRGETK